MNEDKPDILEVIEQVPRLMKNKTCKGDRNCNPTSCQTRPQLPPCRLKWREFWRSDGGHTDVSFFRRS